MVSVSPFGRTPDGTDVTCFTLDNGHITVRVMNFGATVLGIDAPDLSGERADVVLGYDTLDGYTALNPSCFGATIAPSANRIGGAALTIDGVEWKLLANEGENNLHTDLEHALHKRLWDAEVDEEHNTVRMTATLAHGELGLPGERTFTAEFSLTPAGAFRICYRCTSDRRTFVNMTNHTYFNLAGHDAGSVADQIVTINASRIVELGEDCVSTGTLLDVAGTPFDFRSSKALGADIDADNDQIRIGHGYDHCFCIDGFWPCGHLRQALHAVDPVSGRALDIAITAPGAHLYTGNYVGDEHAKGDATYRERGGFAFEPEYYPNTPNIPSFPQCFCGPEHPWTSTIEYRFSTL
ncbi:galactose mutarotase [Collinsella tanakaei]|uniref:aldose epimerase family protein n=1 Tax=Collinsella tanakaei TaxID=626935 RepID=UPI00195D155F|nr:aldose epimerase family protein [Collinsella tanakaei]MBM6754962.1 galactose mutarotase [Collinsella tanakaei]MBM6867781.1 galactose mutarotase [Collinsella tanakaei]